jgi:hypothetical protein
VSDIFPISEIKGTNDAAKLLPQNKFNLLILSLKPELDLIVLIKVFKESIVDCETLPPLASTLETQEITSGS